MFPAFFYPGALHIHTTFSDGTGTFPEVIAAARAAGLRWIIVTDHDTLVGRMYEGWHDDVLVLVGHEITPDHNHFLALGTDQVVDNRLPPQEFVDQVYAQGGFGIIAHPDERVKNDFKEIYRWDDWDVDGPRERADRPVGLELWNLMSDWGEHLTQSNRYRNFFFPQVGISSPTAATLDWWDRLNMAGKRTFGVLGVDGHAFKQRVPWGWVEVFPYRWMFRTLTNYLLLDTPLSQEVDLARQQVFGALAQGRSYGLNRLDGDAPAVRFGAAPSAAPHPLRWTMGDTAPLAGGTITISADVGRDAYVRLICNGRVLASAVRTLRQSVDTPGVYRIEAYIGGKSWLYSNPIFVVA